MIQLSNCLLIMFIFMAYFVTDESAYVMFAAGVKKTFTALLKRT